MRRTKLILTALVLTQAGCLWPPYPNASARDTRRFHQARDALGSATRVEVFRITAVRNPGTGGFHGYPIEQQRTLADPNDRDRVLRAVRDAAADRDVYVATACMFQPHHALRVTGPGGVTDYVLCFRCSQAEAFLPDGQSAPFLTYAAVQEAFDRVLGQDAAATRPK